MTCCAEDIRFIGFVCRTTHEAALKNNHWVDVTAKVRYEYFPAYHGEGPVLYLKHAVSAPRPEEELVYLIKTGRNKEWGITRLSPTVHVIWGRSGAGGMI